MLTDPREDYARGFVPFLGVNVYLDSRPLIPRAETEYWVEKAIVAMKDVRRPSLRVLDIFAGSGCIGLAVLKHIPNAHVTFADINPAHFPTIEKSIKENGLDLSRADFVHTDVWHPTVDVGRPPLGVFDAVAANPPYVSRERGTVSASALAEEPHEALLAEDDGFALIEKTIRGLPEHLATGGVAWMEHEPFQTTRVAHAARVVGLLAETRPDQYEVERYTRFQKAVWHNAGHGL